MIRAAIIVAALIAATPASARTKGCMGAIQTLCSFARAHGLTVISGFRRNARVAGTRRRSLHASGRAIDVRGCGRRCIRAARARGFAIGSYARCTGHRHLHLSFGRERSFHKGCGRRLKHRRFRVRYARRFRR